MTLEQRHSLVVVSALGLAFSLMGCSGSRSDAPPSNPRGGPAGSGFRARPVPVRTASVKVQDVVYTVKALGSLEAEEMVQVTAEVEGAVSAVRFHEGDRATRDTVLLHIDPDRHRLEAQRAEAAYLQAQADLKRSQQELERRERLSQEELIAAEEVTRSRGENERLTAQVAASKAAWDIALQNLRRSEVRAPLPGVINTRTVETGQYVRAGTVLATIVDVRRLRLRFKISEGESLRVAEGQEVSFRVAAIGSKEFKARVYHVGEVADPATRQVEVLAWVDNPGELKPGFFAEVDAAAGSRSAAVVVPEGAIKASESGFVAYVVEDGKARMKPIRIGLKTDQGEVEILSGLKGGETVVVEGSDLLADGVVVQDATFENPEMPRQAPQPERTR
jgi:multidrug efflux system membrane fusion protein